LKSAPSIVDAATDQVRALRARTVIDHFKRHPGTGAYLRMGNTAERIFKECGIPIVPRPTSEAWMPAQNVAAAAGMETTLRQLTDEEFVQLHAHGFEVANSTLHTRCKLSLL
jgi:NTE family protein